MEQRVNSTENQINTAEEKSAVSLYELEYDYIPQLVKWYQTEKIPVEALLDSNWMKEHLLSCGYQNFKFDFNNFICKPVIINDNHIMVLYTFPESYMTPLAKYGAILLQKRHKANAQYYTLERSDDFVNKTGKINWVLGSMDVNGTHINFGYVEECKTEDEFIALIKGKFISSSFKDWLKSCFRRLKELAMED